MPDLEPYYAVIFSSRRTSIAGEDYAQMATRMATLASQQDGYVGFESVSSNDGKCISVSYWKDEQSIRNWKKNIEHLVAQQMGREKWYESFELRIAKIEREYSFERDDK